MPMGWNDMYALWKGHLSQSSKVSWRSSVHLQLKKPLFHEVSVHVAPHSGSPPPLESGTQSCRPFAILPQVHTRSPAHNTPLPVQSPLQGCPTHGRNVLQLQETFGLLCSPSAENSHRQCDTRAISLKQNVVIDPHRPCPPAACAQAVQTGISTYNLWG